MGEGADKICYIRELNCKYCHWQNRRDRKTPETNRFCYNAEAQGHTNFFYTFVKKAAKKSANIHFLMLQWFKARLVYLTGDKNVTFWCECHFRFLLHFVVDIYA